MKRRIRSVDEVSEQMRNRLEDFEFMLDCGEFPERAAARAGWPNLNAAEQALRRVHHPASQKLDAIRKQHERGWAA